VGSAPGTLDVAKSSTQGRDFLLNTSRGTAYSRASVSFPWSPTRWAAGFCRESLSAKQWHALWPWEQEKMSTPLCLNSGAALALPFIVTSNPQQLYWPTDCCIGFSWLVCAVLLVVFPFLVGAAGLVCWFSLLLALFFLSCRCLFEMPERIERLHYPRGLPNMESIICCVVSERCYSTP